MEKYLPEWFNEQEFESFLAEGPLTRQAWIKGLKRWRRTKFMLRNMLGRTPMKYISRAMKSKHAIMARTAMQNARDIQNAQDREEAQDAASNYIRQEQVDADFENFISEKLNSGSDRAVHFGTRPSANERATMKNLTGDPKVQAKLKKREQRKDEKRYSTESFIAEADDKKKPKKEDSESKPNKPKADDKKPSDDKKAEGKEKVEKVEKKKKKKDAGDNVSPTEMVKKGNLARVVVVKGRDDKFRIISRASYDPNYHTIVYPKDEKATPSKSQLKTYLDSDNFRATEISGLIFPKEEKAKPEKRSTDKEKNKKRTAKKVYKRSQSTDVPGPWEIIPPDPSAMMRKGGKITAIEAQESPMISQLVMDPKIAKILSDKKFLTPDMVQRYNEMVQANPAIVRVGDDTRTELFDMAVRQNNKLSGKKLVAISSLNKQGCLELSKEHTSTNSTDKTPKADIFVTTEDSLELLVDYLNGYSCTAKEKIKDKVVGFSYKKGVTQIASAQASETLATLMIVENLVREVNAGELPADIMGIFNDLVNQVKNIQQLAKSLGGSEFGGTVTVNDPQFTMNAMKKMSEKEIQDKNWTVANQFKIQSAPIKEKIENQLEQLMANQVFKKALIFSQLTGKRKFTESSLGDIDGILMASTDGTPLYGMMLPPKFEDVLYNPAYSEDFDELASVTRIDIRAKSRPVMRSVGGQRVRAGMETTPFSFRTERMPASSLLMQEYEPENLDKLFEYTFLPPDYSSTTMAPDLAPTDAAKTMKPIDAESFGVSTYSEFQRGEDQFLNSQNILSILNMSGIMESISMEPIDFEELGMKLRYKSSPVVNKIVVNGVNYEIPVMNTKMDESIFHNYDAINSFLVERVKEGLNILKARDILAEEIGNLLYEKRDYKREYKLFHGKAEQRAKRSKRVLARRKMAKKLGKKAIQGKDIDHKNGNALDNSDSNLRVRSINSNRGDKRKSKKKLDEARWWKRLTGSWEWTDEMLRSTPGQEIIDVRLKKLLSKNKGQSR